MAVFAVLGALDRMFGNRLGLGKQFEEGILAMGALALARVPYGTYLKWVWKFIMILTIVCLVILSAAALL